MRAQIWKDRARDCWCFVIVSPDAGTGGARATWNEALAEVLAELGSQPAAKALP